MKGFLTRWRWYHATRLMGAALLLYGLLSPKDPDRGTLIAVGSAFIGGEFVAKSEPSKDK